MSVETTNAERWQTTERKYREANDRVGRWRSGAQRMSLSVALEFGEGAHLMMTTPGDMESLVGETPGQYATVIEALAVLWEQNRALAIEMRKRRGTG